MRKLIALLIALNMTLGSFAWGNDLASATAGKSAAIESIDYLLSVDRIHFYTQNLADFLDGKKSPELIQVLRSITPEDIYSRKIQKSTLQTPDLWQQVVYDIVKLKSPQTPVTMSDLEWNYNFFKNKLMDRFAVRAAKPSKDKPGIQDPMAEMPALRSVPKIKGEKYLLDVERYIAEKTTRAIIWDAILNDRDFEFHVGTQRDFQETIDRNQIEVISEIKPMANNYNKIFLTFNKKTGRYAYVMNLISGDDRIKHLIAQLRLIKFNQKSYLVQDRNKVRIFGSASKFHQQQEKALLEIYDRLPHADKIIIGQKGAIEDAIHDAGKLDIVKHKAPHLLKELGESGTKASKFQGLADAAIKSSTFQLDGLNAAAVKIDNVYKEAMDSVDRNYRQFNSEQPSHEFTDYLLEDKNGNIKRWRVISAVWGDEIIPIASAINKSGHKDVVYIGTAGAIAGKGIKVGDVIAGDSVQSHSGKTLYFSKGSLTPTPQTRTYSVGQVYTPFDETDKWLKAKGPGMDIVEVETGYLRERLGPDVKLEAYFLISDVVGSESETLAHAAQNSSKRKRGQLRLLENLFVQNNIRAPISNFEPIVGNSAFKTTLRKLTEMRPSRDVLSLFQVAQVALRENKTSTEQLEELLKSQPAFDRNKLDAPLKALGAFLLELQSKAQGKPLGLTIDSLMNGTYNPAVKTKIAIVSPEGLSAAELQRSMGSRLDAHLNNLSKFFEIAIVDNQSNESAGAKSMYVRSKDVLHHLYESEVLLKSGFSVEIDAAGKYRIKEIPGLARGVKCEAVFR